MSKINILEDNAIDVVVKMSDCNPGAIMAMSELIKHNEIIDPDSIFGEFSAILRLNELEIYGTDIYILFNDKCDKDVRKLIILCRATQLGFYSGNDLKEMSLDQMRKINLSDEEFDSIDKKVCNFLPNFAKH